MKFNKASRSGTTASADIDHINHKLDMIKKIQNKKQKVEGTSQSLDNVFAQLATAESLLTLLKNDELLQTAVGKEHISTVLDIIQESKTVLDKLSKGLFGKLSRHKLNDQSPYNEQLSDISSRFDKALKQASLNISESRVSFSERTEDCRAASDVFSDTHTQASPVFGTKLENLASAGFPQERQMVKYTEYTQAQSVSSVDQDQNDSQTSDNDDAWESSSAGETSKTFTREIYKNKVDKRARIMTGNLGIKPGRTIRSTIHHNTIGADARIMTGDAGGLAAVKLAENFFP